MENLQETFGSIIGLSVEKAREELALKGFELRIVKSNGKSCVITHDFNTSRLNVHLKDEKVFSIDSIG